MRLRRLVVAAALAAALVTTLPGCFDLFGGDDGPVYLRIENASTVTFDVATMATVDGPKTWYEVAPGEITPYEQVSAAYRIASFQVVVGTDTLRLQVIDYVGEEYVGPGYYTHLLDVADPRSEYPSLVEVMRRDR